MSGAAMLVERAAFLALGGFDEQLFLYKEDEDLGLRMRGAGWQVIYEPAAARPASGVGRGRPASASSRGVELLLRQALREPAIARARSRRCTGALAYLRL